MGDGLPSPRRIMNDGRFLPPWASERSKLGIEGITDKRVCLTPSARTIGEVRQEVRP
jgi:hypothetical protein